LAGFSTSVPGGGGVFAETVPPAEWLLGNVP
jgi:hypothetical protein